MSSRQINWIFKTMRCDPKSIRSHRKHLLMGNSVQMTEGEEGIFIWNTTVAA